MRRTGLAELPWLGASELVALAPPPGEVARRARRAALRVFLCVVTILFSLMVVAYAGRMAYQDWRPQPQIGLLWANTIALVMGGAFLQWASVAARRRRAEPVRFALLGAAVFTVVFLFGQVLAWRQLAALVLGDFSNPAVGFFYMISGVHGLHMLGGLAVLSRNIVSAWSGAGPRELEHSIANCTLYWHFLLGVWLLMFGLLFSGNNLELLLRFCGLR
jgi:cytochrome c oxidase subunit 3